MRAMRVIGLVMTVFVLGGCAMGRNHQDLARLQSQVGMLDERVTQLERCIPAGYPAASAERVELSAPESKTSSKPKSSAVSIGSSIKPATRDIQQALKNAGFYQGSVDGKSGPMTRSAIQEFQRVHGLTDDGVVGRQTWAKLQPYAALSSSSSGEASAAEPLK